MLFILGCAIESTWYGTTPLRLDDAARHLVELLERRRVVDVALLHLEDDGEDVGAAEHPAELVVDVDVRMARAAT